MWNAHDSQFPEASWGSPGADRSEPGFCDAPVSYRPPPTVGHDDRFLRLRLIRSRRVGPATYLRLLSEHGSPAEALAALPEVARAAGVTSYEPCPEPVVRAEMKAAARLGATMLCLGDDAYPEALAEISDAPPVLWALGNTDLLSRPTIAVVGTRNASSLGTRMARHLSKDLGAAGYVVVSGLARGIDALAHDASLETGTIGVHAGGLDAIYPAENTDLGHAIARQGLRVSEMPFGVHPQARHFPRRNRIVSGLAQAVVVIEAAVRSGSLITARMGLEQGREVMAVPGHPLDTRASGANLLLRDGATLIRNADDVIEALGGPPSVATATRKTPPPTQTPAEERPARTAHEGGLEGAILSLLGPEPVAEDQLIRDLGSTARTVSQALAVLELSGHVSRSAGGMVRLA